MQYEDQQHIVAAVDALCDLHTPIETAVQKVAEATGLDRKVIAEAWDDAPLDEAIVEADPWAGATTVSRGAW